MKYVPISILTIATFFGGLLSCDTTEEESRNEISLAITNIECSVDSMYLVSLSLESTSDTSIEWSNLLFLVSKNSEYRNLIKGSSNNVQKILAGCNDDKVLVENQDGNMRFADESLAEEGFVRQFRAHPMEETWRKVNLKAGISREFTVAPLEYPLLVTKHDEMVRIHLLLSDEKRYISSNWIAVHGADTN
jgi:hypothetical protein